MQVPLHSAQHESAQYMLPPVIIIITVFITEIVSSGQAASQGPLKEILTDGNQRQEAALCIYLEKELVQFTGKSSQQTCLLLIMDVACLSILISERY